MQNLSKIILWLGVSLILLGGFIYFGQKVNLFGHLPGDIIIRNKNATTIIPVASCLMFSIFMSAVLFAIRYFRK